MFCDQSFLDDEIDSSYREVEAYQQEFQAITDVKSAAAASSRAGAAASAAFETVAMARAAAARAANRAQQAALRARDMALNASRDEADEDDDAIDWDPDTYETGEVELPYSEDALFEVGDDEEREEEEEGEAEEMEVPSSEAGLFEEWEEEQFEEDVGEAQVEPVVASESVDTSAPESAYVQEVLEEVKAKLGDDSPELVAAVEIIGENGVGEEAYESAGSNGSSVTGETDARNIEELVMLSPRAGSAGSAEFQVPVSRLGMQNGGLLESVEEDEETWMNGLVCGSSLDADYEMSGVGGANLVVEQQPEVPSVDASGGSSRGTADISVSVTGQAVVDGNFITQLESGSDGKGDMPSQRQDMEQNQDLSQSTHNGSVSSTLLGPQHLTLGQIEVAADALELSGVDDKQLIERLESKEGSLMDMGTSKPLDSGVEGISDDGVVSDLVRMGPPGAAPLASSRDSRGVKRKREEPRKRGPWWGVLRRFRKKGAEQDSVEEGDDMTSSADSVKARKDDDETTNQRTPWWSWAAALVAKRSQVADEKERQRPRKRRRVHKDPKLGKSKPKRQPSRMDRVIIPREVPLEDIAKEVVRLKEESVADQEEKLDKLYSEAIEESDRKWVILLCFLTAVSAGLLMIVAHRLDQF